MWIERIARAVLRSFWLLRHVALARVVEGGLSGCGGSGRSSFGSDVKYGIVDIGVEW